MSDADISTFSAEVDKILQYLHSEYSKLQTGRANAALVEGVQVEAYGSHQELKTIAGITVEDARTIVVQPWDKSIMQDIEVSLQKADLGTSPTSDGNVIRINLPPMTEERRSVLAKRVHELAEEARISVRHHRHTAHESIKEEKDEDVRNTELEKLQKAVDGANHRIEETMKQKEEEVMTI